MARRSVGAVSGAIVTARVARRVRRAPPAQLARIVRSVLRLHACVARHARLAHAVPPGGAPRASAPCVLYSAIYGDLWPTISGAAGWIKCNSGATNATECAPLTPGAPSPRPSSARCLLHTAIDETVALVPSPGVNQYRVNGRRVHVQRDYVPMTAVERARALNVAEVVAPASPLIVTLNTTFPFSNGKVVARSAILLGHSLTMTCVYESLKFH